METHRHYNNNSAVSEILLHKFESGRSGGGGGGEHLSGHARDPFLTGNYF